MSETAGRVRVDVWLWRARFFKSRSNAADAVSGGSVRLMRAGQVRRLAKPSELVGPGDGLTFPAPRGLVSLTVLALGDRRGPPAEARSLYEEQGAEPQDAG